MDWIDVKERMPDNIRKVLMLLKNDKAKHPMLQLVGYLERFDNAWRRLDFWSPDGSVIPNSIPSNWKVIAWTELPSTFDLKESSC